MYFFLELSTYLFSQMITFIFLSTVCFDIYLNCVVNNIWNDAEGIIPEVFKIASEGRRSVGC